MNKRTSILTIVLILVTVSGLNAENWPGWRGPRGDGTSQSTKLPMTWDGSSGENIKWKAAIPGTGHSSPVVYGDRIFVASCLPKTQERVLISMDRKTGKVLWQKTVLKARLEKKHSLNSFASGTPRPMGRR